ncbi:Morn repeat domain containing protein [Pandoravirus salinus]|uniref:Morn repeat domain containing protein n=1 Tax=Pandoravirus salinus TaxID=1349410 RepID=S4VWV0_9VIRU|nr:morn repeat domain [Pandoravirus salinus]AGO84853.2 Morn repeat domain containing protein [Pandoravirus salinus]
MEHDHEVAEPTFDNHFDRLPDEVILHALMYVADARSLAAWSATSGRHQRLALDNLIWRRLYETHFGTSLFEPPLPPHVNWHWMYQAQSRPARPTGIDVGTLFLADGDRVYWGDVVNGLPHGFGLCINGLPPVRDGPPSKPTAAGGRLAYLTQCHWVHGQMHGIAVETATDGTRVERRWNNGTSEDHGTIAYVSGARYRGALASSLPHGHGVLTLPNGSTVERKWHYLDRIEPFANGDTNIAFRKKKGRPHAGIYMWADGTRYEGERDEGGRKHGRGVMIYASGAIYEGAWRIGKRHGRGVMIYDDGDRYEGDWCDDMRGGHGTFTWSSGQVYEGSYQQGWRHGPGVVQCANGDTFDRFYHEGKRRGRGTVSFVDGSRLSSLCDDWTHTNDAVVTHRAGDGPCRPSSPCRACAALSDARLK